MGLKETVKKDMGLKRMVEYGLKNSPTFQKSRNDRVISQIQLETAFSQFWPSLDLTAAHSWYSKDYKNPSGHLTLSLTETLYNNGTHHINYHIAKLKRRLSEIKFKRDRDDFCLDIIRAYNNYSLAEQIHLVQGFQYSLLLKQFKSIEQKYKGGEKTHVEYLRFKAQLQRANLSLKAADNDKRKFVEFLKALIGWKGEALHIKSAKPNKKEDFEKHSLPSLINHYDYQMAGLQKSIDDKKVSLARRKYYPEWFVSGHLTYKNPDYLGRSNSWGASEQSEHIGSSLLLTLRYNLWDWGTRRRDVALAKIERNSSHHILDARILNLKTEISNLMLDIKQLKENYELSRKWVDLEKKSFESLQKDYRNGRTTFLDLVDSVANYIAAKEFFYRNHFNLSSSIAEYHFHRGQLYEKIIKK